MAIQEAGTKLFAHVREEVTLDRYKDQRLAVDLASFKLKAWYCDAPAYWRPIEQQTYGYRANLAKLLSALAMATGVHRQM